jgi:hypothetical protein
VATAARRRESVLAISSVALALAPKCPLCYLAIAGALGAAGPWIAPLTIAAVALTIGSIAWRARIDGALFLGIGAAAAILGGRLLIDSRPLVLAGSAALLIAALWRVRKRATACALEGKCHKAA